MTINFGCALLSCEKPLVMGIINYTTDSFYSKSCNNSISDILKTTETMLEDGVDIIDLGAVSTRPGADDMPEKYEIKQITEAVTAIRKRYPHIPISIDTWRAEVANAALDNGASMINDISGGTFDESMFSIIGKWKVPYCLAHTTAKPSIMQLHTSYENILSNIHYFFGQQISKLKDAGANDIIIDPGFGFGKTVEQNFNILKNLSLFSTLSYPVLVGISRKSMIYKTLEIAPENALTGTIALNTIALLNGANILRVHDVKEAKEIVKLYNMIL